MKRNAAIWRWPLLLILLVPAACSQISGSGTLVEKNIDVAEFQQILLIGQGNLELVQGSEEAVTVIAETNILPRIQVTSENRELRIRFEKDSWPDVIRPTRPISYRVTFRALEAVTLQGSGRVHSSRIDVPELLLQADGAGSFHIEKLEAEVLSLRINGSSEMVLAGSVDRQDIEINGSGWLRGKDLASRQAHVRINGSGNVRVQARETLNAEINGSGKITYTGQPNVHTRVRGSGEIVHQAAASHS